MDHNNYSDAYIRGILNTVKTIAMVGISPKDNRPSYFAFKYLLERGYRMLPVNPGQAGKDILGQKVYAKLSEIPEPVDMVDVFRRAEACPAHAREAVEAGAGSLWLQLGLVSPESRAIAAAAGLPYVEDACAAVVHARGLRS